MAAPSSGGTGRGGPPGQGGPPGRGGPPGGAGTPSVQVVQLTSQAKRLQPQLVSVMAKVQEIEKDFDRREEQLQQDIVDSEKKKQQTMLQLQQWREMEKLKIEDDRRELEINEQAFTNRLTWEKEKLKEDVQDFEQRRSEGEAIAHRQEPVTVEVGGEKFRTELSTLTKCKDSLFPDLVKALERRQESDRDGRMKRDPYIFIDRDSRHFRFILNYLRQGEKVMRGAALKRADKEDLQDVLYEVQYYRLTDLERLVQRKMVSLKRQKDFKQLVDEDHCFGKVAKGASPQSPRAADDAERYKWITAKEINLKAENLHGIVFDKVIFEHKISFQDCVLVQAKFIECSFRNAVNLQNADLYKAKFDHCNGIDFTGRFYMVKANTNEMMFVPPLENDE